MPDEVKANVWKILSTNNAPALFDEKQRLKRHRFRALREGTDGRTKPVTLRRDTPCDWRALMGELPDGTYRIQLIGPDGVVLNSLRIQVGLPRVAEEPVG